jgi:putative oxidoreductase
MTSTIFVRPTASNNTAALTRYSNAEDRARDLLRQHGIKLLRVAIGIIFVWFGVLKMIDQSPVVSLIQTAYPFMPEPFFIRFLGVWETIIGIGLISGVALRATLALFVMQMSGTFTALALAPKLFFLHGNVFLLTSEGEFVAKNIVFISAGLVIAAYSLKPIGDLSAHRRGIVATMMSLL